MQIQLAIAAPTSIFYKRLGLAACQKRGDTRAFTAESFVLPSMVGGAFCAQEWQARAFLEVRAGLNQTLNPID